MNPALLTLTSMPLQKSSKPKVTAEIEIGGTVRGKVARVQEYSLYSDFPTQYSCINLGVFQTFF